MYLLADRFSAAMAFITCPMIYTMVIGRRPARAPNSPFTPDP
jgi:hypothetical protein